MARRLAGTVDGLAGDKGSLDIGVIINKAQYDIGTMSLQSSTSELIPILLAMFALIQGGVIISGFGTVAHSLQRWLSKYTRVEEPDPTAFIRSFERAFDMLFAPVGESAARCVRAPPLRQILYVVSIGVVVIAGALVTYFIAGGAIIGATVVSYQTAAFSVEPVSLFRAVVALVVLCGFSVMMHAQRRAHRAVP